MVRYRLFIALFFILSGCAQLAPPPMEERATFDPIQPLDAPVPSVATNTTPVIPLEPPAVIPAPAAAPFATPPAPPVVIPPEMAAAALTTLSKSNEIQPVDVWQRIRNGFAMAELTSPLVEHHQQWYASRPDYMARISQRAERYLYFIVEEVEKRGMPMEIALLPMIESAFNPGAYSGARASGIWQFIPSTGKSFGMQQNWWYDGRRNIITATTGALDYLQKLHDMFGDWELALAAYNCGENAVDRAQKHNRKLGLPVNYASLKLPGETRNYVPKLLGVKNLINDPARFNLSLQPIANKPYFFPVITARHIDVKLAAELAEISMDEFLALNPAHNRPVILQENADVLLLPVAKVDIFLANLENYNSPLVSWQSYKTKKGERLDKLAPKLGLSLAKLRSVNGLSPNAKFSTGQPLLVPLIDENIDYEFEAFNTQLVPFDQVRGKAITHTARKGETLSSIARRYQVSLPKLKSWNKGVKKIRKGQRIYIMQPGKPVRLDKGRKIKKPGQSKSSKQRKLPKNSNLSKKTSSSKQTKSSKQKKKRSSSRVQRIKHTVR